jgi:cyclophilin family peptidyl-prolyl cis-trans isomerase
MHSLNSVLLFFLLVVLCGGSVVNTACRSQNTKEAMDITPDVKEHAVLETTFGKIELELYRADAPKTVENFVGLATQGLYDGVKFHRVAKGFVIQTGDVNGRGGTSIWGQPFEDELGPDTPSYKRGYVKGVVAMANRGPNTNTSQFFIALQELSSLPKNYTIFGKVADGMDVVEKIGQVDIVPQLGATDGEPKQDIVVQKVTITLLEEDEKEGSLEE